MGAKCCYTVDTMRETLRCLTPLFDVVRLVDPTDTAVVTLEEGKAPSGGIRVLE